MKTRMSLFLLVVFLAAGCGNSKATARMDELEKKNADLTARVKTLEDDLLETNKKLIQYQSATQQINGRLRDIEGMVDQIRTGPR